MKNKQAFPFTEIKEIEVFKGMRFYATKSKQLQKAEIHHPGMTLRDYVEIKAMAALIICNPYTKANSQWDVHYDYDELCKEAEYYADAMFKQRKK